MVIMFMKPPVHYLKNVYFVGDPEILLMPISEVTDGEALAFLLPVDLDMRRIEAMVQLLRDSISGGEDIGFLA